jgi:hypothetical protein
MVSSGGGDPLCVSSGVVSCCAIAPASSFRGGLCLAALARLSGGRRFAAGRRLAIRRLVAVRRFAIVRRLAAVRRFSGVRFFPAERAVAARFLRFAICCLLSARAVYQ